MAEGLMFGDLSVSDRKLISTDRNVFEVMQVEMDSGSRFSTTDSTAKNYNSTERFGIEIKLNNSVSDSGHIVEINSKSRSAPCTRTSNQIAEEELILKLQDLNSGFRINMNNSAGSKTDVGTQSSTQNETEVKDSYLSIEGSQENLNSTRIPNSTQSLSNLGPKPQRLPKRQRSPEINSKKSRKIDGYFLRENSEISEFEKNVNSQEVHEVLGTQTPTSSNISNILFSNTPNPDRINSTIKKTMVNSSIQTESDIDQNSIEARRLKNQRAIKGLELEINQALNRIRITNSTTNFLDLTMTPDSTSQSITVPIYPPALGVWKQLRSLQTRKIILEVRTKFYKRLRQEGGVPDWAVMFCPPQNLLQTERAIESTVGFRQEMANQNLQMLEDLLCEESGRITQEINANMASLRVHYDSIESSEFNLEQATDALNRFMMRAQQQENNSLSKKFNSIMAALKAALWKNMPSFIRPPPDAILPRNQGNIPISGTRNNNSVPRNAPQPSSASTSYGQNYNSQNFQGPARRDWQPLRGGRGRGRGGRGRGQGRIQKRNSTQQKDPRRTLRQMMDILLDQI